MDQRYVIIGAGAIGAIGGTVGGVLTRAGIPLLLVAHRSPPVTAVSRPQLT